MRGPSEQAESNAMAQTKTLTETDEYKQTEVVQWKDAENNQANSLLTPRTAGPNSMHAALCNERVEGLVTHTKKEFLQQTHKKAPLKAFLRSGCAASQTQQK